MNRAERRRQERLAKPRTINLEEQKLKEVIEREMEVLLKKNQEKLMAYTVDAMMSVMAISLNDLYGFGKERLYRLKEKMQLQFDCIQAETVTVEDLKSEAEKLGLHINNRITFDKGGAI